MNDELVPGYYWAFYKTFGWVIVEVLIRRGKHSLYESMALVDEWDWPHYQRFTKIDPPTEVSDL